MLISTLFDGLGALRLIGSTGYLLAGSCTAVFKEDM